MADPISPLNSTPSNACVDDDEGGTSTPAAPLRSPGVNEPPTQSLPQAAAAAAAPDGTQGLVQKFSPPLPRAALPGPALSTSTSAPPVRFLATSSGAVPGGDSYRVAASLMKYEGPSGPFPDSSAEVGTVSVQFGKDNDVQVVGTRSTLAVNRGGYGLSITGEAGVIRANLGEHNDDGSLGGNVGAGAELCGGEATINTPVGSVTGGLSVSMSLSGSMGVRDADKDGEPEFCAKFSVPAFTLGACVERFW
jgi:hypothetical protein